MALYFPVFAPKVFSPRVLIRENKTVDLCLGFSPRIPGAFSDVSSHCAYNPSVEKTNSEWSNYIYSITKQHSSISGLIDQRLPSNPCCCCPHHWTYGTLSKQFSSSANSGKCSMKTTVTTKEILNCDQPPLKTGIVRNEDETSAYGVSTGFAPKRKLSLDDTCQGMSNRTDPLSRHSSLKNGSPCQSSSAKKLRIRRPKTYQCPYCEVCCSNQGQLKGHVRIHTGKACTDWLFSAVM